MNDWGSVSSGWLCMFKKEKMSNNRQQTTWMCRRRRRLNHGEKFPLLKVERFLEEEVSVGTFYSIFFLRFDISQGPGMLFSYHAHCPAKATLKQKRPPWKHTFHSLRCKSMKLCRSVVGAPSRWKEGLHFYHIPAEELRILGIFWSELKTHNCCRRRPMESYFALVLFVGWCVASNRATIVQERGKLPSHGDRRSKLKLISGPEALFI